MAGPCWPKHSPSLFTVLKNLFVWMLCSKLKSIKFKAGPRSPTSPVTAQFIPRRWKIISSWWCADLQQRWNERLVVLPQTRSNSFHGVEKVSRLVDMKIFKNIRTHGWAVLPQARPSFFHGVKKTFGRDVRQLFKNIQIYGSVALPNISCHGTAHFAALKKLFLLRLCRLWTTFKTTVGRASQNTVQLISRRWGQFFWMVKAFLKTLKLKAGPCSFKHSPVPFTVLKNLFVWIICNHLKTFKLMAGPRSPTSPVTAQLISRRWKIVSSCCYAVFQQRSNERLVVLP